MPVVKIKQIGANYAAGEAHFRLPPGQFEGVFCPPIRLGEAVDVPQDVWALSKDVRRVCEEYDGAPSRPFSFRSEAAARAGHWKYKAAGITVDGMEMALQDRDETLRETERARATKAVEQLEAASKAGVDSSAEEALAIINKRSKA